MDRSANPTPKQNSAKRYLKRLAIILMSLLGLLLIMGIISIYNGTVQENRVKQEVLRQQAVERDARLDKIFDRPMWTPTPPPADENSPQQTTSPSRITQFTTPPPASNFPPAVATPPNGEAFTYGNQPRIAPFEIKSARGTNYLVKLATISGEAVLTVFVRGGETVNIDVPLGTYVVKYASGDTWYGYDALFGPNTGYSKASTYFTFQKNTATQVEGYTITLYKVPYGNLHTERIKPNEF